MNKSYSFKDIFESSFPVEEEQIKISNIIIPIIQRDYAQGRQDPEIKRVRQRFLNALLDAVNNKPIKLDFVYGDIDNNGILTPLDGQQRLTTLFLLYWYAAKKENVFVDEYSFLNKFSYRTRYSARDFCECLVNYNPCFSKKTLSDEIINQNWFPWEWKKDPTISSMLVMLDCIRDTFLNVDDLWHKIDKSIRFYFLPIHDMGLTDELYIKMNSRGKPLTLFENFKAELEQEFLKNKDVDTKNIIQKIDKEWTDLLWQYKDEYNSIDNAFLHYFRFICDVICYKKGSTPLGKNLDEIELIKEYFSYDAEDFEDNIKLLESYFDCWNNISKKTGISNFFNKFISYEHEEGKVIIDSRYQINAFEEALSTYGDSVNNTARRQFPLSRFIFLYSFIVYCNNIDKIPEEDFRRRIRIINNLINNSEYEMSNSESRQGGNRIPAILKQVDSIIINGVINTNIDINFNAKQIQEEIEKLNWTSQYPDKANKLYKLEDHELLYGQISVLGLENFDLFKSFEKLFECSYDKINMALLTVDNYAQNENNWRYQLGSSDKGSYIRLCHSTSKRADIMKNTLCKFLTNNPNPTNDILDKVIADYIQSCVDNNLYDWRYYYIKYSDFRPGRYGKYCWNNMSEKPYEFDVMWSQLNLSEYAYSPFLKLIDKHNKLSKDDFGRKIIDGDKYIVSRNDGYFIYSIDTNALIEKISINQNEQGIDIEDRIEKMKSIYN